MSYPMLSWSQLQSLQPPRPEGPIKPLLDPNGGSTIDVKYPDVLLEGWGWFYERPYGEWYKDRKGFIFGKEERSVTLNGQLVYAQLPPALFGLVWEKNSSGRWRQQVQPWYRDSFLPGPVPSWVLNGSALASRNLALPEDAKLPAAEIVESANTEFNVNTRFPASTTESLLPPATAGRRWQKVAVVGVADEIWKQVVDPWTSPFAFSTRYPSSTSEGSLPTPIHGYKWVRENVEGDSSWKQVIDPWTAPLTTSTRFPYNTDKSLLPTPMQGYMWVPISVGGDTAWGQAVDPWTAPFTVYSKFLGDTNFGSLPTPTQGYKWVPALHVGTGETNWIQTRV